jgi:hypothetical protein
VGGIPAIGAGTDIETLTFYVTAFTALYVTASTTCRVTVINP